MQYAEIQQKHQDNKRSTYSLQQETSDYIRGQDLNCPKS